MRGVLARSVLTALLPAVVVQAADPQWRRLETKGDVTPVNGSVIAYHPPSRRIVLFGGTAPGQEEAEYRLVMTEWSRSPETPLFWRNHEAKGARPGGRCFAASAYDPVADRLVIFGGAEDRPQRRLRNDVHVLDHASGATGDPVWSEVEPAGPAPEARASARGVFLNAGQEVLFFGGCTRGPYGCDFHENAVWLLSGLAEGDRNPRWRRVQTQGPTPEGRSAHTMTLCPGSADIVVFGGVGKRPWNDAWVLKIDGEAATGVWVSLPIDGRSPAGRYGHSAGCLPTEDALIVFGGTRVRTVASDLWLLTPLNGPGQPQWKRLPNLDLRPAAREHAHLIFDRETGLLMVNGGIGAGQYFSDSWLLDLGIRPGSGGSR